MSEPPPPVPILVTTRLTLRPLRIDDAAALHPLYGDAAAMTYWTHGALPDEVATRAQLAKTLDRSEWRNWAITVTGRDTAIGTVACLEKRQGKVTEIGYSLNPAHGGHGYAREAVAAVIDQLFAEGQRRVFADTDPDNAPSNSLLAALGFTREGRLRGEWETHIGVRDSFIWGLLRDEWAGNRR